MNKHILAAFAAVFATACHAQVVKNNTPNRQEQVAQYAQTARLDPTETASVESADVQQPSQQQLFEGMRTQLPQRPLSHTFFTPPSQELAFELSQRENTHQFDEVNNMPPVAADNGKPTRLVTFTLDHDGALLHYKWSGGGIVSGTILIEELVCALVVLGMMLGIVGFIVMRRVELWVFSKIFPKKNSETPAETPVATETTATETPAIAPAPTTEVNDLEDSRDELETAPSDQTAPLLRSIAGDSARMANAMEGLLHEWRGPACQR